MWLEVGEGRRHVGEPETGNGPVGVLGDPPAVPVAFDRELENPVGDRACGQWERVERPLAQAGLGDERPGVRRVDDQSHVVDRLAAAAGIAGADDTLPALHRKSERFQQRLQHGIGFEAVPTASAGKDALNQGVWIQRLRLAQLYGDVLIRHAQDEGPVYGAEPGGVGGRGFGQANAVQQPDAGGNIEHHSYARSEGAAEDRKSTRLNSSHEWISYA